MLHTPDGSDATSVSGHGSPGGFQIHSPRWVCNQRLLDPVGVKTGPVVSLAVSVIELRKIRPAPVQLAAHCTVAPQYGLARPESTMLVAPFTHAVPPP